ncbi:MAG: hypothetical protein KC593_00305 [Myxococcales bacterium]|nr:hypothetical protein [Myxococcales bacterium]
MTSFDGDGAGPEPGGGAPSGAGPADEPPAHGSAGGPFVLSPSDRAPARTIADFNAAMDVFKTLLGQLVPSGLLGAFGVMAAASLAANSPLWVAQYLDHRVRAQVFAGDFDAFAGTGLLSTALKVFAALLSVLVFAARLGLARPMRALVLGGDAPTRGVGDILRVSLERFAPNLGMVLAYAVAVSVGFGACILPGFAAAIMLYPALYLVATGREFGDAFGMGVDWISRHTGALLGTLGVLVAMGVVLFCCSCGTLDMFGSARDVGTSLLLLPLVTVVNEAISAVTLTFLASGCIAADQAESTTPTRGPTGPF